MPLWITALNRWYTSTLHLIQLLLLSYNNAHECFLFLVPIASLLLFLLSSCHKDAHNVKSTSFAAFWEREVLKWLVSNGNISWVILYLLCFSCSCPSFQREIFYIFYSFSIFFPLLPIHSNTNLYIAFFQLEWHDIGNLRIL